MRNIFFIGLGVWICFIIEYFLAQWFPMWLRPNFLLLLVIFFNLYRGIRHSLLVAFLAGMIQDCFSPQLFGLNTFSFMLCAYLTTFLKMYIYESGASASRLILVFLISFLFVLIGAFMRMIFVPVNFGAVIRYVMVPQVFATTVVSFYVLKVFRQCALKLFA